MVYAPSLGRRAAPWFWSSCPGASETQAVHGCATMEPWWMWGDDMVILWSFNEKITIFDGKIHYFYGDFQ